MEEEILEIMKIQLGLSKLSTKESHPLHYNCSKETANTFERFFEWFVFGSHPFIAWYESESDKFFTDEVSNKKLTTQDLFTYWKNEVDN